MWVLLDVGAAGCGCCLGVAWMRVLLDEGGAWVRVLLG
jgi:hypothetical protein